MKKVILVVLFLLVTAPVCLSVESLEMGLDYSTEVGEKNWEDFQNAKTAQDYGKIIERMKELEARYENDPAAFAAAFESVFIRCQFHLLDTSIPGQKELQQYLLAQCRKIRTSPPEEWKDRTWCWINITTLIEPLLVAKDDDAYRQWKAERKENTLWLLQALRYYKFLWQDQLDRLKKLEDAIDEKLASVDLSEEELKEATVVTGDILNPNDPIRAEIHPEKFSSDEKRQRYKKLLYYRELRFTYHDIVYRNIDDFYQYRFGRISQERNVLDYLKRYYANTPKDLRELRKILKEHNMTKDFQKKIINHIKGSENNNILKDTKSKRSKKKTKELEAESHGD